MTSPPAEFSRRVPLAHIGPDGYRQTIAATAEECIALARRFKLLGLDRLIASVGLHRQSGGAIALDATFEAEFTQECVVSLEPVPGAVSQTFSLIYGPPGEAEAEIELSVEEIAFEPLPDDAIDIGEAVAQELSLVLPQFPRDPAAVLDPAATPDVAETPFAALARWRKRQEP
jgi:uncharacterized metal-binding protein YceD (DUF177 family)